MKRKIVIAGGGFGGFYTAQAFERLLPRQSTHVTLVNEVNFLLYTPLLPGAAAGTLDPRHVVVPLREELRKTDVRVGRVVGFDRSIKQVELICDGEEKRTISYDHLVVALGSSSRVLPIEGLAKNAVGFKSLADAIYLRNHLIEQLELAESSDDAKERSARLGFVFVGGGYAGVEAIAELHDFATELIDLYPHCRLAGMRWVLVEAAPRILYEIDEGLATFATREIEGRGIEVKVDATLESCTDKSVKLSNGEEIPASTLVWTAGVVPRPEVSELGLPLDASGRIKVDSHLRVEGCEEIWAVGDAAAVPNPVAKKDICPPTAQHAIRQGRTVARNVAADFGVGRARPFRYKTRGVVVDLGRHQAVASFFRIRIRGFLAWWITRTYHLMMMPGLPRKLRLVVDWTVGIFFGRDASELSQIGKPRSFDKRADPCMRRD